MSELERDPMHELLCAWLLGETSPEEGARVEAALADDADLRAERARLESVLGLVRTSLGGPERLSDASLQKLLTRAGHAPAHPQGHAPADGHGAPVLPGPGWNSGGLLRAAAAVLVLGGGLWATLQQAGVQDPNAERFATVDQEVVPSGPSEVILEEFDALRRGLLLQERDDALAARLARQDPGASDMSDAEKQGAYYARAYLALERDQLELAKKWLDLGDEFGATFRYNAEEDQDDAPHFRVTVDGEEAERLALGRTPSDGGRDRLHEELKRELVRATNEGLTRTGALVPLRESLADVPAAGDDGLLALYALDARAAEGGDVADRHDAFVGAVVVEDPRAVGAPAPEVLPSSGLPTTPADAAADLLTGASAEGARVTGGLAVDAPHSVEPTDARNRSDSNALTQAPDTSLASNKGLAPAQDVTGKLGQVGGPVAGQDKSPSPTGAPSGPSSPGPAGPATPGAPALAPQERERTSTVIGTGGGAGGQSSRPGGSYRGVGDVVPPGGGGGGGSAGPASPGPAGAAAKANPPAVDGRGRQAGRRGASAAGAPSTQAESRSQVQLELVDAKREDRTLDTTKELERKSKDAPLQDFDVEVAQGASLAEPVVSEKELQELAALGYGGGSFVAGESGSDDFFLGHGQPDDGRGVRSRPAPLDDEQVRHEVDRRLVHLEQDCLRLPHERPRDMYFRWWGDNPWEVSERDPLSTFAADVDTASYTLARRYLRDGLLPERAQVRTEEFVNYFRPDLPAPIADTFAISSELAPSPFGGSERRWMLRVGVRGKEVQAHERQPLAITFVLDVSGSMKENGRLELVKHAIRLLVSQLDARDSVALVVFNREARLVLPMTSAAQRGVIESALHPLTPDGGTNAEAGLVMGYEVAGAALSSLAHNRVVLLSDGVANVGQTDQDRVNETVRRQRERGIYLNTIGVGMNNHNDVFLEQLANKGDGICDYVDDARAAERAIVERFTGAFTPIASDVKIQVEFDPQQVLRYRLLGYENRAIADADFRNDAVDAGEVGAGHQVTALYEVERAAGFGTGQPLATVRLRWKEPKAAGQDPREVQVFEREHGVQAGSAVGHFDSASPGYRRVVLAAQLAEFLRRSTHARGDSVEALVGELQRLADQPLALGDPETQELRDLAVRARELGLARAQMAGELDGTVDELRRYHYLREQLEELEGELRVEELRALERTNEDLERRIRVLLEREVRSGR